MGHIEAKIRARAEATDKLNELTVLIAMGAVAAVGVFAVVAAQTVPGHAASSATASTSTDPGSNASGTTSVHQHDFNSGSISSSSGPPLVVSGGSH